MTDETESYPPPAAPVCERESCHNPLTPSRGATPRKYCSQSCRQRAYEERRLQETVALAMGTAVQQERAAMARGRASRDASHDASHDASRDGTRPARLLPPFPTAAGRRDARNPPPQ